MFKFMVLGDLHLKVKPPRSRIDDFYETQKIKLTEVNQLAKKHNCRYIICTGDILDKPLLSITDLFLIDKLLKIIEIPIYSCLGNHDIFGYNTETYNRSSLRILATINDNLNIMAFLNGASDVVTLESPECDVAFISFNKEQDEDPGNYRLEKLNDKPLIGVFHGMLTVESYPFQHTKLYDVETEADLTICGHDHLGFGYIQHKGKHFLNPGSLTRQSASMKEIDREPQVAIVTVIGSELNVELVKLKTARPGEEVLDRSELDEKLERVQLMEQFTAIIESENKELDKKLNVFEIIDTISQLEKVDSKIKKLAIEKLEEAIEKLQHKKEA